jgi:hypothetical protein
MGVNIWWSHVHYSFQGALALGMFTQALLWMPTASPDIPAQGGQFGSSSLLRLR